MMIKAAAFLGNPGRQYSRTRHNLPWMLLDYLSFARTLSWGKKFNGLLALHPVAGRKVSLIKPLTAMNKSGECVQKALHFFKFHPGELLVVHDDTELEFGQIDFKSGGGLSGHNGLRSILQTAGTRDFLRMRLGISRPSRGKLSSHVLGGFTLDESAVLPRYLESGAGALEYCLEHGFDAACEQFRKKKLIGE
jgi:peptidyl-tRNA hydrolase, PTH1 family